MLGSYCLILCLSAVTLIVFLTFVLRPTGEKKNIVPTFIKEASLWHSREPYRNPQPAKMQSYRAQSQQIDLQYRSPIYGSRDMVEEGVKRLQESEGQEVCCEIASPHDVRCSTRKSYPRDCLKETWARPAMLGTLIWKDDSSGGLSSTQRTTGSGGMLRGGEMLFPRQEHISCPLNAKWSALSIRCTEQIILIYWREKKSTKKKSPWIPKR